MGIWIDQLDLTNQLSAATFANVFNDPVTGATNPDIVNAVIDRAEQEVLSWLVGTYGPNIQSSPGLGSDIFLKGCALEFAIVYAWDRYPEYVKAMGKEREERFDRAMQRMQRVLQARQRPTVLQQTPANVGGVTIGGGPRLVVDGADGSYNGGDY